MNERERGTIDYSGFSKEEQRNNAITGVVSGIKRGLFLNMWYL